MISVFLRFLLMSSCIRKGYQRKVMSSIAMQINDGQEMLTDYCCNYTRREEVLDIYQRGWVGVKLPLFID